MKVKFQHVSGTQRRSNRGFTLMEMILVLLIIGLLVGVGAVSMKHVVGTAEETTATSGVSTLTSTLLLYRTNSGMYPTNAQGLQALVTRPTANPIPKKWKAVSKPSGIIDPWKNPYQYKIPGIRNKDSYDVYSLGADGVKSEDDIGNWD